MEIPVNKPGRAAVRTSGESPGGGPADGGAGRDAWNEGAPMVPVPEANPTGKTALLAAARAGDMDAFAALFEPLRPMIFAVAVRLVGPDDADDVVMETFLKAWRALPGFAGRASLKTWLLRIARNAALDLLRSRSRRGVYEQSLDEAAPEDGVRFEETVPDPRAAPPDLEAMRKDLGIALERALAELDPSHRTVFLLREVDGLSYKEIAEAVGVRLGTVMSRLFYARRALRRSLRAQGVD